MKPLTVDSPLRPLQQKGTDAEKKTASGAFLNSRANAGILSAKSQTLRVASALIDANPVHESGLSQKARIHDLLASLKLGQTSQNVFAVRALISERLPLTLALVQTLARIQRKYPAEEASAARIGARAVAAGIDPESPEAERFFDQCLNCVSYDNAGSGGGSQHRQQGQSQEKAAEPGKKQDGELAEKLADVCIEAFKNPGMMEFCRPGPAGSAWIHVPFAFPLDSIEFSGIFRILYNYSLSKTECLVADIKSEGSRRLFCVSGAFSALQLRYASDKPGEAKAVAGVFAKRGLRLALYESPAVLDEELMGLSTELDAHV